MLLKSFSCSFLIFIFVLRNRLFYETKNLNFYDRETEEDRIHVFSGPVYLHLRLRHLRSRVSLHVDDESLQTFVHEALIPSLEHAHSLLSDSIIPLLLEPEWLYLGDTLRHYISNYFVEARGRLMALIHGSTMPNSLYIFLDNLIADIESFKFLTFRDLQAIHWSTPPVV